MWPQWIEPLPTGAAGTFRTLERMADLVREESNREPAVGVARAIISALPAPTASAYIAQCFLLARDFIKYKPDKAPYEVITGFPALLDLREGDCDDKVIFLCTLLRAAGVPSRFVAQSYNRAYVEADGFDHVYCEALIDGAWVALDPTADGHKGVLRDMGWRQELSSRGFEYRHAV